MLLIQRSYCVLHAFQALPGYPEGGRGMLLIQHLCFTCFEAIPGYHEGGRGMLLFQRSHCVLHAFGRYQGTMKEAVVCY